MLTLFIRTLLVYLFMFVVLRLMGKRQLSDMQPFDLAITLLIADLASVPMSDPAVPLLYGIIPIIAMFLLHRLVSYAALKSEGVRKVVCGSPLVVIAKGIVREDVMRSANYTLNDLTEQLRAKDVFAISQVEYAILETNGSLSVLLKGPYQQPTNEGMNLQSEQARPSLLLVTDGKIHPEEVQAAGMDEKRLNSIIKKMGCGSARNCLFVSLDADGMLHAQNKQKPFSEIKAHFIKPEEVK